jgi:CheY-like chemotaxis protein
MELKMHSVPTYFYPSSIVWVDDDTLFLKTASELFESNQTKTFNDPQSCLEFFESYKLPAKAPVLRGLIEDERYELSDHLPVDLNVSKVQEFYFTRDRSQEISVIIIDNKMPGMNGIELCQRLQTQPAKKILLTGEASHEEAIKAFNDNVIDRFIRKDSPTLVTDIQNYVDELSKQYFRERSEAILSHLQVDFKLPLSDKIFADFFQQICLKNSIKEYYLIDKNGSLMMIDDKSKCSYLIVHTDRTLDRFIELNEDLPEVQHLLETLRKRQKIPYFGIGNESWEFKVEQWDKNFYEAEVLEGREKYYYIFLA